MSVIVVKHNQHWRCYWCCQFVRGGGKKEVLLDWRPPRHVLIFCKNSVLSHLWQHVMVLTLHNLACARLCNVNSLDLKFYTKSIDKVTHCQSVRLWALFIMLFPTEYKLHIGMLTIKPFVCFVLHFLLCCRMEPSPGLLDMTGCPGSVITVLMLSLSKVQYCDNWRMAANLTRVQLIDT